MPKPRSPSGSQATAPTCLTIVAGNVNELTPQEIAHLADYRRLYGEDLRFITALTKSIADDASAKRRSEDVSRHKRCLKLV